MKRSCNTVITYSLTKARPEGEVELMGWSSNLQPANVKEVKWNSIGDRGFYVLKHLLDSQNRFSSNFFSVDFYNLTLNSKHKFLQTVSKNIEDEKNTSSFQENNKT